MGMGKWTVKAVFDRKHQAVPGGAGKIEILVYFGELRRSMYLGTDVAVTSRQWDAERGLVCRHGDANRLNCSLLGTIRHVNAVLLQVTEDGRTPSPEALRAVLDNERQGSGSDFFLFALREMEGRHLRPSTERAHRCALEALRDSGLVRTVRDLTPENIQAFDNWLRKTGPEREQTTLHNYHKRIKPYVNAALRQGLIQDTPYRVFQDKHGRHKPRVPLTEPELMRIRGLEIADATAAMVRDLFVFQCYTGLAWADLDAFDFERDCVRRGDMYYIDGTRVKTGTRFYAPVLRPAMEVLERYGFRLTVPDNQHYNRILKGIGIAAGLRRSLSSHIARHTFATTVTLANDVSMPTLARMLGHTNIRETQIYAKVLNTSIERQAEMLNKML